MKNSSVEDPEKSFSYSLIEPDSSPKAPVYRTL